MGYITVLYGGYKKVIKRLIYFSSPTKCFYDDVLSNMPHTILSELLRQSFGLFWLNIKLFKVSILNSQIFLWPVLLLLWTKVIFCKITTNKKQKNNNARVSF